MLLNFKKRGPECCFDGDRSHRIAHIIVQGHQLGSSSAASGLADAETS